MRLPRLRPLRYLWALPNTLLGVSLGLIVLGLGGRARIVGGVLEFHGGLAGRLLAPRAGKRGVCAITFGHVVLGLNRNILASVRSHERVHVRQYERWGPFFLPAYAASSAWQLLRGRRAYRDNAFERDAYENEA